MKTVEILFHDSTTLTVLVGVTAVVHGLAAVTIYVGDDTFTYPWINVQRIRTYDSE